jgi:hypothetical protein
MKVEIGGAWLHRASGALFSLHCVVMEVTEQWAPELFFYDQFKVRQVAVR